MNHIGEHIKKSVAGIFPLCFFAYMLAYLCRVGMSTILPELNAEFASQAGLVGFIGTFFFWSYAIGQLINGKLGDNVNPYRMVFIGLSVSAVLNICFGFSKSVVVMLIFWTANGFFQSMLWGPIMRILSYDKSDGGRNKNSTGMMLSTVVGNLLAWGGTGALTAFCGWRAGMLIPAFVVSLYAIFWFIIFRSRIIHSDPLHMQKSEQSIPMRVVFVKARLIYPMLAAFFQGIVKDGIGLWMPSILIARYNVDLSQTLVFLLMIPVFNFLGVLSAAKLNKIFKFRENNAALTLFIISSLVMVSICIFGGAGIVVMSILTATASGAICGTNTILLSVVPLKCSDYGKSSSVAGFLDFFSYFGSGISSLITGFFAASGLLSKIPLMWLAAAISGACVMSARVFYKKSV